MSGDVHTVHVRKVIVFDYTITSDTGDDMDTEEIRGQLRAELNDPIGRAVDACLEPWEGDTFTVQECVVTVTGDDLGRDEEASLVAATVEFLGTPGVKVHRRWS